MTQPDQPRQPRSIQIKLLYGMTATGAQVPDPSLTGVGTITYYAEAIDDVTVCVSTTRTALA